MKKFLIRLSAKIISIIIYKQKQIEILNIRLLPNTSIDSNFYVGANSFFNLSNKIKELKILKNVVARKSCNFLMYENATLIIRENVFFNNYCSVNCLGYIEIGENTIFGEGVKIYDHNHLYARDDNNRLNIERDGFSIGIVKIGSNCWIGSNVTVLNNVEIGNNVIIGANCLIFKSIPPNSIVKSGAGLLMSDNKT